MTSPPARGRPFSALLSGTGFGLTSGVLTTLGLIVGLHSGTDSRSAVVAGITTIAVADALSDALGIHVSQESTGAAERSAWVAAAMTFAAKLAVALTFLVPVLTLALGPAVIVSVAWGLVLLTVFSVYVAHINGTKPTEAVLQHLSVAAVILVASLAVGTLAGRLSD